MMWLVIALGVLVFLLFSQPGKSIRSAVAYVASGEELVVFSPLQGKITYQGKPASGAKVLLETRWGSRASGRIEVEADENGHFSLPAVKDKARFILPVQFVAHQGIYVNYHGSHLIWSAGKLGKGLFDELGGRPVDVVCELLDPIERVDEAPELVATSCRWSSIETSVVDQA